MPKSPSLPLKRPHQSGPMCSRLGTAPLDDFAGAEHGLDAEHVVGGHAVLEAMSAAGVEGDVAADGANQRAGGVGREVQLVRCSGHRYLGVHHARLDHGNPLGGVQPQNAGQAVERDDDAVRHGQRATGQTGAAPARDKGEPLLVAEADQGDHFIRGLRDSNGQRSRAKGGQRVALIGGQVLGPGQQPVGREQGSQAMEGVRHSCSPVGTTENSPAFQRWVRVVVRDKSRRDG